MISTSAPGFTPGVDDIDAFTHHDTDETNKITTHSFDDDVADAAAPVDTGYVYDDGGNLIDDGDHTYVYDAWNRVRKVHRKSDGILLETRDYDAIGRRIARTVTGSPDTTHYYYYDGHRLIEEHVAVGTGAPVLHRQNVFGLNYVNEPVAYFDTDAAGAVPHYILQDANYNVVGVTDDMGQLVQQISYTPYGKHLSIEDGTGAAQTVDDLKTNFGYGGLTYDPPTGNWLAIYRDFGPDIGRWLQGDPNGTALALATLGWEAQEIAISTDPSLDEQYADGMNLYEYAGSNSLDRLDPSGLRFVDDYDRFESELLIARDFDDIVDSFTGDARAYLGAQGAATFGSFWTGGVALLPQGASAASGVSEGVSDFADFYADQIIYLPVEGALAGIGAGAFGKFAALGTTTTKARKVAKTGRWTTQVLHGSRFAKSFTKIPNRVARNFFPRDWVSARTRHSSAVYRSERAARQVAREKIGRDPVKVGPNKWRSKNGKWQYRAKPNDVADRHVHLEELDPDTGEVLQNYHLRW